MSNIKSNTPDMNITKQINSALNDIRATLIDLSCTAHYAPSKDFHTKKAEYQLNLANEMIIEHVTKVASIPWSDRKHMVDEEFS